MKNGALISSFTQSLWG